MNKFEIPNPSGGHIIKAHDLNLIYSYLKEGFTALSLSKGNAILYGCEHQVFGATSISYDSGWLMIAGEIYYFQGRNINLTAIPDPCFVPSETVVSPSPRSMADASSKDVHFKRVAVIENYGAQPVKFRMKELAHFGDSFHQVYPNGTGGVDFEFAAGWAQLGLADYRPLKIRKIDNYLEIVGSCKTTAFSANSLILTLPTRYFGTQYRPLSIQDIVVAAKTNPASFPDHMMIVNFDGLSGTIKVCPGTYTGSGDLTLMFNHRISLVN